MPIAGLPYGHYWVLQLRFQQISFSLFCIARNFLRLQQRKHSLSIVNLDFLQVLQLGVTVVCTLLGSRPANGRLWLNL
jgi:hypothetical protein